METKLLTTKVKVKSCVFILYLCCQQYFLETKASIKKSDVAKYLIERELGSSQDTFSVLFKQGCQQNRYNPTCADLLAYDVRTRENFTQTCSCKYANRTFLPERGKCLSDNQAANNLTGGFCRPGTTKVDDTCMPLSILLYFSLKLMKNAARMFFSKNN